MKSLSIIMPAYNEERRIGATLDAYGEYFDTLAKEKKVKYEIVVVINNTTDNTEKIVKQKEKKHRSIRHITIPGKGKGNAVAVGFRDALKKDYDYIGFVDADLSTKPEEYWKLFSLMKSDCIIASRYVSGAIVSPKPALRRILASRIYNAFIRALLLIPYRDTQCGAKIFTKKSIQTIIPDLSMSMWAFDIDLIYHLRKKGFIIQEVPTVWSDSDYSTINFKQAGFRMGLAIIRLRIINSPLRRSIRLYDFIARHLPFHEQTVK